MQDSSNLFITTGDKPLPTNNRDTIISFLIEFNELVYNLDKGNRKDINKKKNNLKNYINRL